MPRIFPCLLSLFLLLAYAGLGYAAPTTITDEASLNTAIGASENPLSFGAATVSITGEKTIGFTTSLQGQGAASSIVQGNNTFRLFDVTNAGSLNGISGLALSHGNAGLNDGGAVYVNGALNGNITGATFTGNTASGGGAVYVNGDLSGGISGATFTGNTAGLGGGGGAVYVSGDLTGGISGSTFTGNTAGGGIGNGNGGAVYVNGSIFGGISGSFTNNTASSGGAVYVNGSIFGGISGGFTNNTALDSGGAVRVWGALNGAIGGSAGQPASFSGNHTTGDSAYGGAVFVNGSILGGISYANFSGNYTSGVDAAGGAVYVGVSTFGGISHATFTGNYTSGNAAHGGAIYASGLTGNISNSLFENNKTQGAGSDGGAIWLNTLDGAIDNSQFTGNQASRDGGALTVNGALSGGITGATFTGNTAGNAGGAVFVNGDLSGGITGSTFTGNTAGASGGAVFVWGDLDNISGAAKFIDNSAKYVGGALYAGGNLTISHAEFIGNKAIGEAAFPPSGRGGAIFHGAAPWLGDPNRSVTLNAGASQRIVFSGNTMRPGGAGAPVANSIYFGNIISAPPQDATTTATFNVAGGGILHMLDPLASQPDDMDGGAVGPLGNLALSIDKTGPGTWVLAGLNHMQSATNWVVSAGALHLVNDASGAPAHINLANTTNKMNVANPASFTLKSGAALLLEPGNSPHQISGQKITLESGGTVGLAHFKYGPLLANGQYTALKLVAPSVSNQSSVPVTSGTIAVGAFDYYYENLAWSGNDLTFMVKDKPTPNPVRTGAGSITGTSAIGAFNPAFNAFNQHALALFNQQGIYNPYQQQSATQLSSGEAQAKYLNSLWVTPAYSYTNQNASNGNVGYDLKTPGFALGYDRQLCDNAFVGLGASVSWPEYQGGGADINASDITLALYGGVKLPYALELDGHIGYGWTRYDQDRQVLSERYSNKYNGNTMFVGLGLGRSFELGENTGFSVRPGIAYDFIHLNTDGFDEGAGAFALKTDDYSQDLHRVKAGLDATWRHAETGFRATGQVYYLGLYGDREASASAHFVNDPINGFNMIGNGLDQHSLGLGLNVALPVTERWEFGAGYNVLLGSDTVSQQGMLNVTFKF